MLIQRNLSSSSDSPKICGELLNMLCAYEKHPSLTVSCHQCFVYGKRRMFANDMASTWWLFFSEKGRVPSRPLKWLANAKCGRFSNRVNSALCGQPRSRPPMLSINSIENFFWLSLIAFNGWVSAKAESVDEIIFTMIKKRNINSRMKIAISLPSILEPIWDLSEWQSGLLRQRSLLIWRRIPFK